MMQMMKFNLTPRFELRQEQRMAHLQILCAPKPPDAVCGIEGMKIADSLLKEMGAVGMLIGGLAKELWSGVSDEERLAKHKDVDVLVLSYDCIFHPKKWMGGIDWWVSHDREQRPTNGNPVGLLWRVQLDSHARNIPKGLYLCPLPLLRESVIAERRTLKGCRVVSGRFKDTPTPLYPSLDEMQLRWSWANLQHPVASFC